MSLQISINSFSYKKNIPEDLSGNGGGFVFDCRGIYNPGRIEYYKKLSGLDYEVREFLETQSKIKDFLNHTLALIDITVNNYLERNFEHLQINYGCTGGQHRSVYCAEATAAHLYEKYPEVIVKVVHSNRENWAR